MAAGTIGFITTVIFAVKNTHDRKPEYNKSKEFLKDGVLDKDLAPAQRIKNAGELVAANAKDYIPTAVAGAATLACFWGSHQISAKQIATIGAATGVTTKLFNDYKRELANCISKEKLDEVREAVAVRRNIRREQPIDILKGNDGDTLFYDEWTNSWFRSSPLAVQNAMYNLNRKFATDGTCFLRDFYGYLGIALPDMVNGIDSSVLGWDCDYLNEGCDSNWIDYYTSKVDGLEDEEDHYILGWYWSPIDVEDEMYS
jgi:hypothetical protein